MADSESRSFAATLRYGEHYPRRCQETLDKALYATPVYEAWRRFDPGPAECPFTRLAALPALGKADLRASGPQGLVPLGRNVEDGLARGEIELVATSGTTSDQVMNVWYQPWWNATEAASWRLNAHARAAATGRQREAILTSPWCAGVPCEDGYLPFAERRLDRFLYLTERSDPSRWPEELMDRMVDEINAFQPVTLEANPSFLARLARYIERKGRQVHMPALIVLTYEFPSALHYRQIGRVFQSPVASSYGSTESGHVFMECEAGRLHQVADCCHVDFLPFRPEHGGPALGRILVTTFDNPWRSLVRFDVGDVVRLAGDGPCPCGCDEGLTLASVEGRTVNLTLTPDGRAVPQGAVDRALCAVPGLVEYQLVQTGRAAYHLQFVSEDVAPERVAGAARESLRALYGAGATISTEACEGIPPDPPGKYRRARALIPIDDWALVDEAYWPAR